MKAQELKNSILQLAAQGKLVEQSPEEGTARELLAQIKDEKEQLIKDKKIKKEKPLPEITEEEIPFDIPESWEWVRLGNVLDIARGASPRPIKAYITSDENGVNWIKIGDSDKGGKYINSTSEKITLEGKEKSRFVKKGSFLLSNSMSFGRPYILNIDGCIHDGWLVLSQQFNIFERDYLYYLLSSSMVFYQFCSKVSGAVVNNLNSDKVRETIVPVPPLAEQKRIITKIEKILPYIEQYDMAYAKLEAFNKKFPEDMKKSILQMAMQGKLVEQRPEEGTADELYEQIVAEKAKLIKEGKIKKEKPLAEITEDEIPFDIPASWKWVRLRDLCSLIGDIDHNMPRAVDYNVGKLFLSAKDLLDDGTINYTKDVKYISVEDFERLSKKAKPQYNDIIYSRIGAALGKARVVERDVEFLVSYSCCVIRPINIDVKYLRYYLESPFIMTHSVLARQSIGVPDLGMGEIKSYLVALPPLAEQKRIVAKLEQMLPYCEQLINVSK